MELPKRIIIKILTESGQLSSAPDPRQHVRSTCVRVRRLTLTAAQVQGVAAKSTHYRRSMKIYAQDMIGKAGGYERTCETDTFPTNIIAVKTR